MPVLGIVLEGGDKHTGKKWKWLGLSCRTMALAPIVQQPQTPPLHSLVAGMERLIRPEKTLGTERSLESVCEASSGPTVSRWAGHPQAYRSS
jgi:hypothetical protein